jgi:hypothetical protein
VENHTVPSGLSILLRRDLLVVHALADESAGEVWKGGVLGVLGSCALFVVAGWRGLVRGEVRQGDLEGSDESVEGGCVGGTVCAKEVVEGRCWYWGDTVRLSEGNLYGGVLSFK